MIQYYAGMITSVIIVSRTKLKKKVIANWGVFVRMIWHTLHFQQDDASPQTTSSLPLRVPRFPTQASTKHFLKVRDRIHFSPTHNHRHMPA